MPTQKIYDQVASELRNRNLKEGLWTRAFAESGGNIDAAKATYIRLRAEQIAAQSASKWNAGVIAVLAKIGPTGLFWGGSGMFLFIVAIAKFSSNQISQEKTPLATVPALTPSRYVTPIRTPKELTPKELDDLLAYARKPIATPSRETYIPINDEIIYDLYPGDQGLGELRVENGTDHHAIAKLLEVRSDIKVCSFVVRAHTTGGLDGLRNGSYRLIFAFGDAIIKHTDHFDRAFGFAAFKDTLPFVTTTTNDGKKYTTFQVTLHKVVGGNAPTASITQQEFDRY